MHCAVAVDAMCLRELYEIVIGFFIGYQWWCILDARLFIGEAGGGGFGRVPDGPTGTGANTKATKICGYNTIV